MKKALCFMLLVLLTVCLFVGCSSSPEKEKVVVFKFYEGQGLTDTFEKTFTESKWSEVLVDGAKITIGDTEYTLGFKNAVAWYFDTDYLLVKDKDNPETSFLSVEDEITNNMVVYCYMIGG